MIWFDSLALNGKTEERKKKKNLNNVAVEMDETVEIFMCCTFASVVLQAIPSKSFRITVSYYKCEIADYFIRQNTFNIRIFILYAFYVSLLHRSYYPIFGGGGGGDGCDGGCFLLLGDGRKKKIACRYKWLFCERIRQQIDNKCEPHSAQNCWFRSHYAKKKQSIIDRWLPRMATYQIIANANAYTPILSRAIDEPLIKK